MHIVKSGSIRRNMHSKHNLSVWAKTGNHSHYTKCLLNLMGRAVTLDSLMYILVLQYVCSVYLFFSESLFLVIIVVGGKRETYKKKDIFSSVTIDLEFDCIFHWLANRIFSFTNKVWNRKMLSYCGPQVKGALGSRVWAFPFGHRQTIFLRECDTPGKKSQLRNGLRRPGLC